MRIITESGNYDARTLYGEVYFNDVGWVQIEGENPNLKLTFTNCEKVVADVGVESFVIRFCSDAVLKDIRANYVEISFSKIVLGGLSCLTGVLANCKAKILGNFDFHGIVKNSKLSYEVE